MPKRRPAELAANVSTTTLAISMRLRNDLIDEKGRYHA
jgi:hypothetical protein